MSENKCKDCFANRFDYKEGYNCIAPVCIKEYDYDPKTRTWIQKECVCLKGKNCCICGNILEKEDLKPIINPFAGELSDDHSEHLICDKCGGILAEDI